VSKTRGPEWTLGFSSQPEERGDTPLSIEGQVPDWLAVDLVRNGPALFTVGGDSVNHWFDGLAKLHKFAIAGGAVSYRSRFIESRAYKNAMRWRRLASQEFGTSGRRSVVEKIASIFSPPLTDNTNVNVARLAGRCLALTETANINEFSLQDLSAVGSFEFDDGLKGQITTAHPHFDPDTGYGFNLLTRVSLESYYQFFSIAPDSAKRELLASVPVSRPGYVHSFAMTKRFVVLMECPFLLEPLELVFGFKPYIENYHWRQDSATRFLVVDKSERRVTASLVSDPCFCFHHVNAFEDGDRIMIDAAVYENAAIVDQLRLSNLLSPDQSVANARLKRFVLNLTSRSVEVERPVEGNVELPRINYGSCNGKAYTFAYGCSQSSGGTFLDQLSKVNLQTGDVRVWSQDGAFPGEPVFAARPGSQAEDEGAILSVVLDGKGGRSFLLVLDAKTMEERARAVLPELIPFGFHGQLFPH